MVRNPPFDKVQDQFLKPANKPIQAGWGMKRPNPAPASKPARAAR